MRPKKTILLVDSDFKSLSVRKFMLETLGYRVQAVETGAAAIALFASERPRVVLAELELRDMGGNGLILGLKAIDADVPMILTSATVLSGSRAHCADAFLGEGCRPADIVERVRVMSARKRGPQKQPESVPVPALGVACA